MNYIKSFICLFVSIILFITACQKKLDSLVGKELLDSNNPTNVIDTTLEVWTLSDNMFSEEDTIALSPRSEYYPLGYYKDSYFGDIATSIYLQLKPIYYPYVLQTNNPQIDSVVLGLRVPYVWGDSVINNFVQYKVNEITDASFTIDNVASFYNVLKNESNISVNTSSDLNTTDLIDIRSRFDSFISYGEAVVGQYRIKLKKDLFQAWFDAYKADSTAFDTDEKFNALFKGFKITPNSSHGNNLSYISLSDTTTRLTIYYHDPSYPDSPFVTKLYYRSDSSAYALNIKKTRSPIFNNHYNDYANNNNNQIFLEMQPGGYTLLKIPQLQDEAFKNIVVNQAILMAEVDPTYYNLSSTGTLNLPPSYIYLDVDTLTTNTTYIPLLYDLYYVNNYTFFPSSAGIDYGYLRANYVDSAGKFMGYKMNLSRTVQNEIKKGKSAIYRLYAPILLNYTDRLTNYAYANTLPAGGRTVLIGNYNGQNKNPHRLRLRLIYTKTQ